MRLKRVEMPVWLASMRPETRGGVRVVYGGCRKGDVRVSATWMLAGPQGMKEARLRSRMRRRDLWT